MAKEFTISTAARDAACDAITALVDGTPNNGKIRIHTAASAATIVTIDLDATAFGNAATMNISNTSLNASDVVKITAMTVTVPAGN